MNIFKMRLFTKTFCIFILVLTLIIIFVQILYINELSKIRDQGNTFDKYMTKKTEHSANSLKHGGLKLIQPANKLDMQTNVKRGVSWNYVNHNNSRSEDDLQENLVPNNVYYVWCGNRTFQFKHYLSVMSVWKFLRADVIEIHYQLMPLQNNYDSWLDELKSTVPSFSTYQLPDYLSESCSNLFGIELIDDRGGIYVADDTVLTNEILKYRKTNFTAIFDDRKNLKVLFSKRKHEDLLKLKDHLKTHTGVLTKNRFVNSDQCLTIHDVNATGIGNSTCLVLKNVIIPSNIFTIRSSIGDILRFLYYGVKEPVSPHVDRKTPIPKIIHYVWYNNSTMSYIMYLSILSSIHIVKPEKIYIHGDLMLYGYYWDKVKSESKIVLIYREPPRQIYGTQILYRHHKSDVIRNELLLKYGGIYLDWDVIWLQPIDDLLSSGYDVIINYDHMIRQHFPDTINMGVVMAKPGAKYLTLWQNSYRNYKNKDFFLNPIEIPYKVYEKNPCLVRIEKHLQVMCYLLKCHPIFHPDHKKYYKSQPFDWRRDAYAIHFTHPDPPELTSEALLHNATGSFSDIGRHVLKKAGQL